MLTLVALHEFEQIKLCETWFFDDTDGSVYIRKDIQGLITYIRVKIPEDMQGSIKAACLFTQQGKELIQELHNLRKENMALQSALDKIA